MITKDFGWAVRQERLLDKTYSDYDKKVLGQFVMILIAIILILTVIVTLTVMALLWVGK